MTQQTNLKTWRAPLNQFRVVTRVKDGTSTRSDHQSFLEARKLADYTIGYPFVMSVVVLNHDGRAVYSRSRE